LRQRLPAWQARLHGRSIDSGCDGRPWRAPAGANVIGPVARRPMNSGNPIDSARCRSMVPVHVSCEPPMPTSHQHIANVDARCHRGRCGSDGDRHEQVIRDSCTAACTGWTPPACKRRSSTRARLRRTKIRGALKLQTQRHGLSRPAR
jgi:hypothetical protein